MLSVDVDDQAIYFRLLGMSAPQFVCVASVILPTPPGFEWVLRVFLGLIRSSLLADIKYALQTLNNMKVNVSQ